MRQLAVLAAGLLMSTGYAAADMDPVISAKALCTVVDKSISAAPCSFSSEKKTVTVSVDLNGADAREMCHTLQISLMQEHVYFDGDQWRLNLKSPFSGENTIAFCDLPQTPH